MNLLLWQADHIDRQDRILVVAGPKNIGKTSFGIAKVMKYLETHRQSVGFLISPEPVDRQPVWFPNDSVCRAGMLTQVTTLFPSADIVMVDGAEKMTIEQFRWLSRHVSGQLILVTDDWEQCAWLDRDVYFKATGIPFRYSKQRVQVESIEFHNQVGMTA